MEFIDFTQDIGPEEEAIISFIAQKGTVRWTDMTNEFLGEKRGWNRSKFVKYWKKVKPHLERVPNKATGRDEYRLNDQFQRIGDKAVLRRQIGTGDVNRVEVSVEKLEQAADFLAKNSLDVWQVAARKSAEGVKMAEEKSRGELQSQRIDSVDEVVYGAVAEFSRQRESDLEGERKEQGLLGRLKHSSMDPQKQANATKTIFSLFSAKLMEEQKRKNELLKVFKKVKIRVVSELGETVPLLTEEDVLKLISVVVPKIIDENKGKPREKPFLLMISYPM